MLYIPVDLFFMNSAAFSAPNAKIFLLVAMKLQEIRQETKDGMRLFLNKIIIVNFIYS